MKIKIFTYEPKNPIICSYCGSQRFHSVGDVIECLNCKGARALS